MQGFVQNYMQILNREFREIYVRERVRASHIN